MKEKNRNEKWEKEIRTREREEGRWEEEIKIRNRKDIQIKQRYKKERKGGI